MSGDTDKDIGWLSLAALVLTIPGALWEAFVVMKLWNWHVAGWMALPATGFSVALGVDLIAALLLPSRKGPKTRDEWVSRLFGLAFVPAWVLLIGWVATT